MNRGELRKRIHYFLNEDPDDPTFYTTSDANTAIQEAMEIIAEEVHTLRQQSIVVTKPGRHWYSIHEVSDVCMSPMRIWSDGTGQRLWPLTMPQLENHYAEWLTVTSDTPQWWYPVSLDTFGIWPGASTGGTVLRVDYVAWPETLAEDTDEPIFDEVTQDLIILYGEYDGLIRQWEMERATDIFMKFASFYLDRKYRSETRRFHYMLMNRSERMETRGNIGVSG